jgi:hypothetical protein
MLEHPVPNPALTAIGDVAVSFALLESTLQTMLGSLIYEHQRVGQIIAAELPFRGLRALALALYRERHGEDANFEQLRDLIRRAGDLEDERNRVMHSVWGAGATADSVTRIKMTAKEKHGLRFDFVPVTAAELSDVAGSIKVLAHDIQSFWSQGVDGGRLVNNPVHPIWGPGQGS